MSKIIFLFLFFFTLDVVADPTRTLKSERFGEIQLYFKNTRVKRVILFFSGDDGWSKQLDELAVGLAEEGSLIAGIDTPTYRQSLLEDDSDCLYLPGEFERMSQSIQKEVGVANYLKPLLVGYSSGSTVTYIANSQHAESFSGGLMLAFCPIFDLPRNFCGDEDKPFSKANRRMVKIIEGMGETFDGIIIHGIQDNVCPVADVYKFVEKKIKLNILPESGHSFLLPNKEIIITAIKELTQKANVTDKKWVPVVELPSKTPIAKTDLVIFLSGDGGWATIDKEIGEVLAVDGFNVIGFNTLKFFWKKKTVSETAQAVSQIIHEYSTKYASKKVVLIGFSMGAEILPFVMNALPKEQQDLVSKVILLSAESTADFEVHIGAWLGINDPSDDLPVIPEINKIERSKIACYYGEEEASDSVCTKIKDLQIFMFPGDHHFDGDYETISKSIVSFISK